MHNFHQMAWKTAAQASNMPSQDVWKFTPVSRVQGKGPFLWAPLLLLYCSPLSPLPVPTHQIPVTLQRMQLMIIIGEKNTRLDAGLS